MMDNFSFLLPNRKLNNCNCSTSISNEKYIINLFSYGLHHFSDRLLFINALYEVDLCYFLDLDFTYEMKKLHFIAKDFVYLFGMVPMFSL